MSLYALISGCLASLLLTKSHPLKRYRDRLVGQEGVVDLDISLIPTKKNRRRLIVIGDVHGCLDELKHLLKKCDFDPKLDHIIFVGDLVAKGPYSLETLTFVEKLGHHCSSVRGNHDDKLMQWNAYLASRSKGDDELADAKLPEGLSRRDEHQYLAKNMNSSQVRLLESLPYIIRIALKGQTYLVVHAGLIPNRRLDKQGCWDVTNMRNIHRGEAIDDREDGDGWYQHWEKVQKGLPETEQQVVLYGHDAGRDLNLRRFTKGLDSRCVRGGVLTAMLITHDGEKFVHVKAKRRYD